jgi:hypothetical protein
MSARRTPRSGTKSVAKKGPTDTGSIREVVQRIVELGPLPPGAAWDESVSDREEWLHSIVPPLTTDEAAALTCCFGPDDCGVPSGDGRPGHWERMIETIAEQDSLPGDDYDLLESAVDEAFGAWSYATRRAIWLDTDSGMADDDEMAINACGSALCVEVV